IAYSDDTHKSVKCAFYRKGNWRIDTAARTQEGARDVSGNYAAGPGFAIAYFDVANGDLRYASNALGQWSVRTLVSKRTVGLFNSILVRDGEAFVYSYGKSADSAFLVSALTPSSISTAVLGGGRYLSACTDNGWTDIAYVDSSDGLLKVRSGPA